MGSIALQSADVIVGVDTHKAEHVGFAIDGLGGDLGELQVLAVPSGYAELLAWADSFGPVHAFGVEGTGSYGSGLAKFLRRHRSDLTIYRRINTKAGRATSPG